MSYIAVTCYLWPSFKYNARFVKWKYSCANISTVVIEHYGSIPIKRNMAISAREYNATKFLISRSFIGGYHVVTKYYIWASCKCNMRIIRRINRCSILCDWVTVEYHLRSYFKCNVWTVLRINGSTDTFVVIKCCYRILSKYDTGMTAHKNCTTVVINWIINKLYIWVITKYNSRFITDINSCTIFCYIVLEQNISSDIKKEIRWQINRHTLVVVKCIIIKVHGPMIWIWNPQVNYTFDTFIIAEITIIDYWCIGHGIWRIIMYINSCTMTSVMTIHKTAMINCKIWTKPKESQCLSKWMFKDIILDEYRRISNTHHWICIIRS